jgi:hypothetical protein
VDLLILQEWDANLEKVMEEEEMLMEIVVEEVLLMVALVE